MTEPTPAVPAGAVREAANALLGWASPASAHVVARRVLTAVAAAGWELVPGPTSVEWGYRLDDTVHPGPTEAAARGVAQLDHPSIALERRRVTEWQPAESTQDGDP